MSSDIKKIVGNLIDVKDFKYDRKFSRVARLHKYWSRKPWFIIDEYIKKYSREGDAVLDPFCGSGIIGLESIIAGRSFIGYDLNPFASFLANSSLDTRFEEEVFIQELNFLKKRVAKRIK